MDPVDTEISEHDEEWELNPVVRTTEDVEQDVIEASSRDGVVHEGVPTYFSNEEWYCEDGHDRDRVQSLLNLHFHLVLEVFGVIECGLVENKNVAKSRTEEVDYSRGEPVRRQRPGLSCRSQLLTM